MTDISKFKLAEADCMVMVTNIIIKSNNTSLRFVQHFQHADCFCAHLFVWWAASSSSRWRCFEVVSWLSSSSCQSWLSQNCPDLKSLWKQSCLNILDISHSPNNHTCSFFSSLQGATLTYFIVIRIRTANVTACLLCARYCAKYITCPAPLL